MRRTYRILFGPAPGLVQGVSCTGVLTLQRLFVGPVLHSWPRRVGYVEDVMFCLVYSLTRRHPQSFYGRSYTLEASKAQTPGSWGPLWGLPAGPLTVNWDLQHAGMHRGGPDCGRPDCELGPMSLSCSCHLCIVRRHLSAKWKSTVSASNLTFWLWVVQGGSEQALDEAKPVPLKGDGLVADLVYVAICRTPQTKFGRLGEGRAETLPTLCA